MKSLIQNHQMVNNPVDSQSDNQDEVFNLDAALAPVAGDMAIFKRIIEVYLKTCQPLFQELKQAVLEKNPERIVDRAHALKGSTSNFAAYKVVDLSAKLEQTGKTTDIAEADGLLNQLEIELTRLIAALEQFKNKEL